MAEFGDTNLTFEKILYSHFPPDAPNCESVTPAIVAGSTGASTSSMQHMDPSSHPPNWLKPQTSGQRWTSSYEPNTPSHPDFAAGENSQRFSMLQLELDILKICAKVLNCPLCLRKFVDAVSFIKHMTCHGYPNRHDLVPLLYEKDAASTAGGETTDDHAITEGKGSAESPSLSDRTDLAEVANETTRTTKVEDRATSPFTISDFDDQHPAVVDQSFSEGIFVLPSSRPKSGTFSSSRGLKDQFDSEVKQETGTGNKAGGKSSKKKNHRCDICRKIFDQRSALAEHRRTFVHKCDVCGKEYRTPQTYRQHRITHTDEKPHKCKLCGRGFWRAHILKDHMKVHANERAFPCTSCDKKFVSNGHLKIHLRGVHGGYRPFKCDMCTKAYPSAVQLADHVRAHTGEKPFQCDICPARFTSKGILNTHKLSHRAGMPCKVCGMSLSTSANLRKHMLRMHTLSKPFNCEQCEAGFISPGELRMHNMSKHTGERPCLCDNCGKGFLTKRQLQIHKLIHTGERPYQCDQCGAAFTQLSVLRTHMRLHSGEKPYECKVCSTKYTSMASLRSHEKTNHK